MDHDQTGGHVAPFSDGDTRTNVKRRHPARVIPYRNRIGRFLGFTPRDKVLWMLRV